MSVNDYIKYITEQVMTYLNKSPEEKRQEKIQQKKKKKGKVKLTNQWLGVLPMAFKLFIKKD